ncbi:sugar phosphate permease [Hephaestia caeni]|uniref:Sugar phosphate permease n=1 Tax=Hephaestia caeni TaxID=645617 RepID=A0A397NK99_9SPHN|nr:MFS transporter [Hephaestia caeni]RIA37982.1 sugar phosphate permease [Hephaestia caeni]
MTSARTRLIYPFYVLVLLLSAYVISYMDRIALSLMVDPIRQDLGLSDTGISLLIGFAFVLLYTTAGIPLGRMADTGNRPRLIVFGMILWCAATAACGLTTGFTTLLIARILVGFGEATLSPASYSLISSYFPPERLGFAISLYMLGITFGGGLATYVVGSVAQVAGSLDLFGLPPGTEGWRTSFLIVGMLGIPFILLMLTVREPRRTVDVTAVPAPPMTEVLAHIREHLSAYGLILGGFAVMAISSLGVVLWGPAYFIRVHGLTQAEVGALFGIAMGVCGTAGLLTGGWLADRFYSRGTIDAAPRIVIVSLLLQTPLFLAVYLAPTPAMAKALLIPAMFAMLLQGGLQGASIQLVAPDRMRGLIVAIYLMLTNIVGMAIGPLLIAQFSEHVYSGVASIGRALATVTLLSSLGSAAMIAAGLPAFRRLVAQRAAT